MTISRQLHVITLSFIFVAQSFAQESTLSHENPGLWGKIQNGTALVRDFIMDSVQNSPTSFMGSKPVSQEVEVEIRQILKDINFKHADTIRIMRLSKFAMSYKMGSKNAFAFGIIGLPKFIFIDEDWFKTLNLDEKKYLIGHEAAHLKYYHLETKILGGALLGALCNGLIFPSVINNMSFELRRSLFGKLLVNSYLPNICIFYPILMLSRYTEYQADKSSILDNNNIDGGVSLLNKWNNHFEDIDAELPQWKIHKWIRWFANEYFTTHPTCDARIAYLKKLEKQYLEKK